VFAERYHEHVLRSPTETRRALVYVYQNSRRHRRGQDDRDWVDPCTSAPWFAGWRWPIRDMRVRREGPAPVVTPTVWLLTTGWKRLGLLEAGETPAAGRLPAPTSGARS
jgi:hypothetical protein